MAGRSLLKHQNPPAVYCLLCGAEAKVGGRCGCQYSYVGTSNGDQGDPRNVRFELGRVVSSKALLLIRPGSGYSIIRRSFEAKFEDERTEEDLSQKVQETQRQILETTR